MKKIYFWDFTDKSAKALVSSFFVAARKPKYLEQRGKVEKKVIEVA